MLEFYKLHNFAGLDPGYRALHKCKNDWNHGGKNHKGHFWGLI